MCALPIFMETRRLLPVRAAGEGQLGQRHFVCILASEEGFREALCLWGLKATVRCNSPA